MIYEIATAIEFIGKLVEKMLSPDQLSKFGERLTELLCEKYSSHWDPQQPLRGNAYRSIMVTKGFIDPILLLSAKHAGVTFDPRWIPSDFIIWIDPNEVTYRIGDCGSVAFLPLVYATKAPLKPIPVSSSPAMCSTNASLSSSPTSLPPQSLLLSSNTHHRKSTQGRAADMARIEVH